ncbi:MAG: hypothetical protein IIX15_04335 [Clostridia bacterium]|nr:hypothetical protein [Clostridia bacterium]
MKLKFCLDRVESGIAVCLCESAGHEKERYEFAVACVPALKGLADGTLFEAELGEDGLLHGVCVLSGETEQRRAHNRARLQALFDKSKRKN